MEGSKELDYEYIIKELLYEKVIPLCEENNIDIYVMRKKGITDVVICKNGDSPKLYLLEVKHYSLTSNRIGVGGRGDKIQDEVLIDRPDYFEKYLRWVIFREGDPAFYVLTNAECQKYASGGEFTYDKQNNLQKRLFKEVKPLTEDEFVDYIYEWLKT